MDRRCWSPDVGGDRSVGGPSDRAPFQGRVPSATVAFGVLIGAQGIDDAEMLTTRSNFLWRKRGWDFDIDAYQVICPVEDDTQSAWTPKSGGY